jgi:hypothetical protein
MSHDHKTAMSLTLAANNVIQIHVDVLHAEYDNHMVRFPVVDASGNVSLFYHHLPFTLTSTDSISLNSAAARNGRFREIFQ